MCFISSLRRCVVVRRPEKKIYAIIIFTAQILNAGSKQTVQYFQEK